MYTSWLVCSACSVKESPSIHTRPIATALRPKDAACPFDRNARLASCSGIPIFVHTRRNCCPSERNTFLYGWTVCCCLFGFSHHHCPRTYPPCMHVFTILVCRATFYTNTEVGACGYGNLDVPTAGYMFGSDADAALPNVRLHFFYSTITHIHTYTHTQNPTQTSPYFNSSCGSCFEVRCRPAFVRSASGSFAFDRSNACRNTSASIIIKIVDECICDGNREWCCGDQPHLDLSVGAFNRVRFFFVVIVLVSTFKTSRCQVHAVGGSFPGGHWHLLPTHPMFG